MGLKKLLSELEKDEKNKNELIIEKLVESDKKEENKNEDLKDLKDDNNKLLPLDDDAKGKLKNALESHFNNMFYKQDAEFNKAKLLDLKAKQLVRKEFDRSIDEYNELKSEIKGLVNNLKNDQHYKLYDTATNTSGMINDQHYKLYDTATNTSGMINDQNMSNLNGMFFPTIPTITTDSTSIPNQYFTITGTGFLNSEQQKDLNDEKKELKSIKDLAKESSLRIAADQSINLIKKTLIKILAKSNSPNIEQLLNSDAGNALISILLSNALRYVPQLKDHKNAESLATEFSVGGLSTLGNYLIDEHVLKFIVDLSSTLDSVDNLDKLKNLNISNNDDYCDDVIYEEQIEKRAKV